MTRLNPRVVGHRAAAEPPGRAAPWVVKVGGSLGGAGGALRSWLRLLGSDAVAPLVVVPGGGSLADGVRRVQARWRFDDGAAHRMAILAMVQTAIMFSALEPALQWADDARAITRLLRERRCAVWRPLDMLADWPDVPPGWDITSDSLALHLARRIGATGLLLVKSCAIDPALGLPELSRAGVLDARFPAWAEAAGGLRIELLQATELERARALLAP